MTFASLCVPSIQMWADEAYQAFHEHAKMCSPCRRVWHESTWTEGGPQSKVYGLLCPIGLELAGYSEVLSGIAAGRRVTG